MSLSAERVALANCAIERTFGQASIAWQAIPHWDTGDPAQTKVRNDLATTLTGPSLDDEEPLGAAPIDVTGTDVPFLITFAQATAATPDALLNAVMPRTVALAQRFDREILATLAAKAAAAAAAPASNWYPKLKVPADPDPTKVGPKILEALILGRALLEDSGYRAPSCLVASTKHFTDLSTWQGSNVVTEGLLVGGNANSLYRSSELDAAGGKPDRMLMIGRRQEIAHGRAATASPGEEPIDFAVAVGPSLEVVGENAADRIQLVVRIRYALRFKDERGVVVFNNT